jgi:ionotropic glutamate receptor
MSLNDSLSAIERAKLAVWDYPVSDKYTKIWQAMQQATFPNTLDEAVERVLHSKSSSEGFAYIGKTKKDRNIIKVRSLRIKSCHLIHTHTHTHKILKYECVSKVFGLSQ